MCGSRGIREISVPSSQFCCEPKAALKRIKLFLFLNSLLDKHFQLIHSFTGHGPAEYLEVSVRDQLSGFCWVMLGSALMGSSTSNINEVPGFQAPWP